MLLASALGCGTSLYLIKEQLYWNGTVLDSLDTGLQFAKTMPWQGLHTIVELVTTTYETGVTWTKDAMQRVEAPLKRLPEEFGKMV